MPPVSVGPSTPALSSNSRGVQIHLVTMTGNPSSDHDLLESSSPSRPKRLGNERETGAKPYRDSRRDGIFLPLTRRQNESIANRKQQHPLMA